MTTQSDQIDKMIAECMLMRRREKTLQEQLNGSDDIFIVVVDTPGDLVNFIATTVDNQLVLVTDLNVAKHWKENEARQYCEHAGDEYHHVSQKELLSSSRRVIFRGEIL